jgi:hypothetical protein
MIPSKDFIIPKKQDERKKERKKDFINPKK